MVPEHIIESVQPSSVLSWAHAGQAKRAAQECGHLGACQASKWPLVQAGSAGSWQVLGTLKAYGEAAVSATQADQLHAARDAHRCKDPPLCAPHVCSFRAGFVASLAVLAHSCEWYQINGIHAI